MNHWAVDYIGKPWQCGATGPDSYDCWGFVRHIQQTVYGVQLPNLSGYVDDVRSAASMIANHTERTNWSQVNGPKDGDIVLLARKTIPVHIGTWIDANGSSGVIHCAERIGVMYSNMANLRNQGWGGLTYFRHRV